ncbi:MAG: M42 family peptidase [bacterium]|nr:M42 family peptidase [bacterium]
MKKILQDLSQTFGPSGKEEEVLNKVRGYFKRAGLEVKTDKLGDIWGIRRGKSNKILMIEAHMDEIALMVSGFEGRGFLRFTNIGGFDHKIFPGLEVMVHGKKKLHGIITSIPPHLQTGDSKVAWKKDELLVDTGLADEIIRAQVCIGDYISLPKNFIELKNSRVAGTSFDNRIGVTLLCDIAQRLKKQPEFTVVFASTFGEEVGLRGGIVSSYNISPDLGICFDGSFGDFPGQKDTSTKLGGGPIISIGPAYHPILVEVLKATAKKSKIKIQEEIEPRPGGTHAGMIQLSKTGVGVAGISVPLRSMHTCV